MDTNNQEGVDVLFKRELIKNNSEQVKTIILPSLVVGVVFSYMAYGSEEVSLITILVWLSIFITISLLRFFVLKTLNYKEDAALIDKIIKLMTLLLLLQGLSYSASIVFFSHYSFSEKVVQTLLLLGMTAGAVGTTGGYKKFYLTLNLPIVICLSLAWLITDIPELEFKLQVAIAVMICLFFRVQVNLAKTTAYFTEQTIISRVNEKTLNQDLSKALDKVTTASESKTRFLASASHDLRQPIHTLQLLSTAISMGDLNPKTERIASQMNLALENLASQMDGLLDISKLDAGIITKNIRSFDLLPFISRLSNEYQEEAKAKDIEFVFKHDTKTALVNTDSEQLERIIRNLLSNAIKYTHKGKIVLLLQEKENSWLLQFNDSGIGISDDEKEKIFEEFYQISNPERDRQQGLGLGLAIVKRLVDLLEIPMNIESELGKGTQITLEIQQGLLNEPNNSYQKAEDKIDTHDSLKGIKVLCLDDEVAVRDALSELFDSFGWDVMLCKDIPEVKEVLKSFTPDVMLADFRLVADITGIEAIKIARKQIEDLPALLISGDTAPERLKQAQDAGIKLLHKPVKPKLLKEEILKIVKHGS